MVSAVQTNEYYARSLLRSRILRDRGDCESFIYFNNFLDTHLKVSYPEMSYTVNVASWFLLQTRSIPTINSPAQTLPTIFFSLACWGDDYINTLTQCCFASLLSPNNLPFLTEKYNVIIGLHTDAHSKDKILTHPTTIALLSLPNPPTFHFSILPPHILNTAALNSSPNNKYWLLGASQSIHLFTARNANADFHVTAPDVIYSCDFFKNLYHKIHQTTSKPITNILQSVFRSDLQSTLKAITQPPYQNPTDPKISVPAATLCSLGLNNAHEATNRLLINNRPNNDKRLWPVFRQLFWETPTSLHAICNHVHPVFLSNTLLQRIKYPRYFLTLDSELEKIIPEDELLYHTTADDDMMMLEVSLPAAAKPEPYADIKQYCNYYWSQNGCLQQLRYYNAESVVPLDPSLRTPPATAAIFSPDDVRASQDIIRRSVQASCPYDS